MKLNRKTKDSVFTKLFGEKKYAFQLYKVFHPEDTESTQRELKIITLENIFSKGEYNDLGLLMNDRLIIFVEAQSAWNGNMAIRTLFYLVETYKRYLLDNNIDIMCVRPAKLPVPEVYVIFTGKRKTKPNAIKLSEHFKKNEKNEMTEENSLELKVKMIYNSDKGDIVFQYIQFCKVFNAQREKYPKDGDKVIKETLKICRNEALLAEFLKKHESEVIDIMSDYIWNEELLNKIHIESEKRISMRTGLRKGRKQGKHEANVATARNMLAKGLSIEMASECTGLPFEEVAAL